METQAVSSGSQEERSMRGKDGRIARPKSSLGGTTVTREVYIVQVTSHRS